MAESKQAYDELKIEADSITEKLIDFNKHNQNISDECQTLKK